MSRFQKLLSVPIKNFAIRKRSSLLLSKEPGSDYPAEPGTNGTLPGRKRKRLVAEAIALEQPAHRNYQRGAWRSPHQTLNGEPALCDLIANCQDPRVRRDLCPYR